MKGHARARYLLLPFLCATAVLCAFGTESVAQPSPPFNHYTVYTATGTPPSASSALLQDQFLTEVVELGPISYFFLPAQKNSEPIVDPFTHQTGYQIVGKPFGATVTVQHQFGQHTLSVFDPDVLLVPTDKLTDPNGPIMDQHFKCYHASGPALNVQVSTHDQWGSQTDIYVGEPFLFCNPVTKNELHVPPRPDVHLTCYVTAPPLTLTISPPISNQFTELVSGEVATQQRMALCLPSTKLGWTPFTPTPMTPVPPTATATPPPAPTCPTTPFPSGTCAVPTKSRILMKDPDPADSGKKSFNWQWLNGTAAITEFGDPVAGSTSYTLCVYDDSVLVWTPGIQGNGTCGTKPCWKQSPSTGTPKQYRYNNKDTNSDGIAKMALKAGVGKAKISIKGKKGNLALPLPITQTTDVTVQLIKNPESGAQCWETVFVPERSSNGGARYFKAWNP